MAGSTLKGAGLGAITGFVGGQFIGAGANVAANVTQNIANQTVRHVAKAGVEAGVETAIDTGISLATGNPISLKNVATDYGLNLITNGSGSVSSKKSATADVPKNKPKSGDVAVTKPRKDTTPVQQLALPGPKSKPLALPAPEPVLALPAPKSTPKTDFYVAPDGATFTAADYSSTYGHREFKTGELDIHYDKHKDEVANVLGGANYMKDQYLSDANYVIKNGTYSPDKHAYYQYAGVSETGKAKYAVVGLDRNTHEITTFHVKGITEMNKWNPNLGIKP
ncbi:TPA: hypothetical protein TXL57_002088 [Streptococcus suis]|nr:hypothetical protein [Streptococcus suis]